MKKLMNSICIAIILVFCVATCLANTVKQTKEVENQNLSNDTKVLVAYFSVTGTTKAVAQTMSEILSSDLYEIVPEKPYTSTDLNYNNSTTRATVEQKNKNARPKIDGKIENMDKYTTILIGYPIWWGEEPRIIDTFIEQYDFTGKTIIPFCTSGSSGISTSETNLKGLCKTKTTWLSGKRLSATTSNEDLEKWLDSLGLEIKYIGLKAK